MTCLGGTNSGTFSPEMRCLRGLVTQCNKAATSLFSEQELISRNDQIMPYVDQGRVQSSVSQASQEASIDLCTSFTQINLPFENSSPSFEHAELTRRTKRILTEDQVIEIFKLKLLSSANNVSSSMVARKYKVSPKTVRDIWTGRSWFRQTLHLDNDRKVAPERLNRKPGRPKGAKDSRPRQKKAEIGDKDMLDDAYETDHNSICAETLPFPAVDLVSDPSCASISSGPEHSNEIFTACTITQNKHRIKSDESMSGYNAVQSVDLGFLEFPQYPTNISLEIGLTAETDMDPFHNDWPFWNEKAKNISDFI